jgi:ABC-type phosphate transport system substrate-binding protein
MLHKRHNSVATLAILLSLVGVSEPAKAFLLAQSDTAPNAFAVPDKLPQDTTVKIAASSSINGISTSLKESFTTKYPQAKVNIKTQDSVSALKSLSEGQADLAAIGRVLTTAEKAQGFISVPISREKIAIVVSKNNPFNGNLTIDQFAKIFRGEITDWAEIGGTPGKIQLIDAPNINDTRQAFPNYPVFQSGEFKTGSTANQLKQDSIEAMIAKLGTNGIGYAVANDVIKRDDVKVITMHQTQPDDPRYPFSEPFNLIYQGTPSTAAQAYLGFATAQGGKQVIANRVGSISAAAVTAIAPKAASDLASKNTAIPALEADIEGKKNSAIADSKNIALEKTTNADSKNIAPEQITKTATVKNAPKAIAGSLGVESVGNAGKPDAGVNGVDKNVTANADVNPDVQQSGEANPALNASGEVNPDVQQSGEVNPNVNGSGEVNPNIQQSGEVNPNVNGSGEVNPNIQQSGESLSSKNNADGANADGEAVAPIAQADVDPDTKAENKEGNWWWWLLPIMGIFLLAAAILGRRKKSDQEPALNDISNINNLDSGPNPNPPGSPGGGVPPVGVNSSGNVVNNLAENTANTSSNMGMAGMTAGGAALAGGAAANLAGRRNRTENVADPDLDLDLDLAESTSVEEIPSNPVSEFTGQETRLQVGDQSTDLQIDDDVDSQRIDNISLGGAALGGAAVSRFPDSENELENETVIDPVVERPDVADLDTSVSELTTEPTVETDSATTQANIGKEFPGDFVLQEETRNITVPDEVATDRDVTSGDFDLSNTVEPDVDVPDSSQDNDLNIGAQVNNTSVAFPNSVGDVTISDVDLSTDTNVDPNIDSTGGINSVTLAGGAAALGGAALGMFNRGDRTTEDTEITEINVADFSQETDLNASDRVEELDTSASFTDTTEITTPDLETAGFSQETDLNAGDRADDLDTWASFTDTTEITTPDLDLSTDTDVNPNIDDRGNIDGVIQAGGAAALGGAAAASGMFNQDSQPTSDLQEFETFETSFDFSEDTTPTNFADAEATSVEEVNSLEGITLDNLANRDDLNLDDITVDDNESIEVITFDDATATEDLTFDQFTLDDFDSNINATLEEITLDDATATGDLTLDEITLNDASSDRTTSSSVEEITFDDAASSDLNLEDITFENTEVSSRSFVSDTEQNERDEEINLDDLGFEDADAANTADFDLLSGNTAEITSLSDQSNDMNNISEWLDSLETPNQDSDNISEWLDTLDKDSFRDDPNADRENLNLETTTNETDDISFQFLEDLLDRDSDPNRNNQ